MKKFPGLLIKHFFMHKRYSKDTEILKQQDALPLGVWHQKCLSVRLVHIENVYFTVKDLAWLLGKTYG